VLAAANKMPGKGNVVIDDSIYKGTRVANVEKSNFLREQMKIEAHLVTDRDASEGKDTIRFRGTNLRYQDQVPIAHIYNANPVYIRPGKRQNPSGLNLNYRDVSNLLDDEDVDLGHPEENGSGISSGTTQFFGNQTDKDMRQAAIRQRNYQREIIKTHSSSNGRREQFRQERNSVLPGYGTENAGEIWSRSSDIYQTRVQQAFEDGGLPVSPIKSIIKEKVNPSIENGIGTQNAVQWSQPQNNSAFAPSPRAVHAKKAPVRPPTMQKPTPTPTPAPRVRTPRKSTPVTVTVTPAPAPVPLTEETIASLMKPVSHSRNYAAVTRFTKVTQWPPCVFYQAGNK